MYFVWEALLDNLAIVSTIMTVKNQNYTELKGRDIKIYLIN